MTRYYEVREVTGPLPVFEVRWSVVDDGLLPLRAFGPASFAACQQFLDLVRSQGLSHAEARDVVWTDEREMVA